MTDAETLSNPLALGAPVSCRMQRGVIVGIIPASGRGFMLGTGGMQPVRNDVEIVWDDGNLQTIPDAIVAEYVSEAKRWNLPHDPDHAAKRAAAIARRNQRQREAGEQRERDAAARKVFEAEAAAKMPAGTQAVIVAELTEDQSDVMSDYYGSTTRRTVILAFSAHTRDLFPELRKAARNFEPTAALADAPESAEHREKYSMGGGYYLKAASRHSDGWRVRKVNLYGRGAVSIPTGEWSLNPPAAAPASKAPTAAPSAAISAPSGMRIEEHTHTKLGFQMWIAILPGRVDREEFDRLTAAAKVLGGWYSRPWGSTPGGFAFKVQASAEAFAGSEPSEAVPTEEAAPMPRPAAEGTADRLRALADRMTDDIAAKLGDRLANTPKRRREADAARIEGRRLQRTQQALRALAEAHEAGTVPPVLQRITSKAAVYDLVGTVIDRSRAGYYDAGIDTGRPSSTSPEAVALWAMIAAPTDADREAEELRHKLADLAFARIPGYFPTPAPIVAGMIAAAEIPATDPVDILEPSAGSGAILDALRAAYPAARLAAYERHASLRDVLQRKGYELAGSDFLEATAAPQFDRVLMNPPFENGQDIDHVRHAFGMLRPGGILVAIMSPGPFFRSDRKACGFREWFDNLAGERRDLPAGAFKESGTGIATVLVTVRK